jgi:hypothetical protein
MSCLLLVMMGFMKYFSTITQRYVEYSWESTLLCFTLTCSFQFITPEVFHWHLYSSPVLDPPLKYFCLHLTIFADLAINGKIEI